MISLSTYLSLLLAFSMCVFAFIRLYDKYMELEQQNAELRQTMKELKNFLEVRMKDWKEIARKDTRYEDFVISEDPKPFKEMFADQDISYVQIHSTQVVGAEDQEYLVGFCGVFEWKDNKIIPLDGDSYSEDMKVFGYEWFEHEGNKSLDILVGEDW